MCERIRAGNFFGGGLNFFSHSSGFPACDEFRLQVVLDEGRRKNVWPTKLLDVWHPAQPKTTEFIFVFQHWKILFSFLSCFLVKKVKMPNRWRPRVSDSNNNNHRTRKISWGCCCDCRKSKNVSVWIGPSIEKDSSFDFSLGCCCCCVGEMGV